jgi:uncharacterized membrane protein
LFGILCALASATVWGAGDLGGGLAARKHHQFQVVALSAASGIALLVICWIVRGEPMPPAQAVVWSVLAGLSGGCGIGALYHGLSLGNAALVAPTAGVVGALLPVAFTIVRQGLPTPLQIAGFACAMVGIWLVAKSSRATGDSVRGLKIATFAGLGLGGFLVLIAQIHENLTFGPLTVARSMSLLIAFGVLAVRRLPLPSPSSNPLAIGTGVLDAAGTLDRAARAAAAQRTRHVAARRRRGTVPRGRRAHYAVISNRSVRRAAGLRTLPIVDMGDRRCRAC